MFPVYYNLYNKAINAHIYTGLPTKDASLEKILRKLFDLLPYIPASPQL